MICGAYDADRVRDRVQGSDEMSFIHQMASKNTVAGMKNEKTIFNTGEYGTATYVSLHESMKL